MVLGTIGTVSSLGMSDSATSPVPDEAASLSATGDAPATSTTSATRGSERARGVPPTQETSGPSTRERSAQDPDEGPAVVVDSGPGYLRVLISLETDAGAVRLLVPGSGVVNARVQDAEGAAVTFDPRGVLVVREAGEGTVRASVEIIVEDGPGAGEGWRLESEPPGETSVELVNVNDRDRPVRLAGVRTDSRGESMSFPVAEARRHGPLSAGAVDHDGLVLAHWVPRHRSGDYSDYRNAPLYPDASTDDPAYVAHAIGEARGAGVDGFLVTWQPYLTSTVDVYMEEAAKQPGWRTAFQLNLSRATRTGEPGAPDPETLASQLATVAERYEDHPSTLELSDGRMVIFAYRATLLDAAGWESVLAEVAEAGHRVAVIGANAHREHLGVLDGDFVYNSVELRDVETAHRLSGGATRTHHLLDPDDRRIWVATVSPGLHDLERKREGRHYERRDGDLYREQWAAAEASHADWTLIVSWNEYPEDTVIEPSVRWGRTYLDLTRELATSP